MASASLTFWQQTPTAPPATWRRAITGHLWLLLWGRSRTGLPATAWARRARLRSKASRSSNRAGVSTASRGIPTSAGGRVVMGSSLLEVFDLLPDPAQVGDIPAQDQLLLLGGEKLAVLQDIIQALPIGAEALDVRHVGAPDELVRSVPVAKVFDEGLGLGIGVVPDAPPGDGEHDLQLQVLAIVGRGHLVGELPQTVSAKKLHRRPHDQK